MANPKINISSYHKRGGSRGIERYTITDELYIGDYHTIVDCFQFCRNILVEYFNNPVQIGGVPHIVEIDDFLFVELKYNCGRVV